MNGQEVSDADAVQVLERACREAHAFVASVAAPWVLGLCWMP
jgi:hypothetical protein